MKKPAALVFLLLAASISVLTGCSTATTHAQSTTTYSNASLSGTYTFMLKVSSSESTGAPPNNVVFNTQGFSVGTLAFNGVGQVTSGSVYVVNQNYTGGNP